MEGFFLAADVGFAVIFTLEMLVRLLKIRWAYFKCLDTHSFHFILAL